MPMFSLWEEKYISKVEETKIGKIAGKHIHTHKILRTHICRETRRCLHPTALAGLKGVLLSSYYVYSRLVVLGLAKWYFPHANSVYTKYNFHLLHFQCMFGAAFHLTRIFPSVYGILSF